MALSESKADQISPIFFIQTILSVLDFHQFNRYHNGSWTITTGRELHPAPEDEPLLFFTFTVYSTFALIATY